MEIIPKKVIQIPRWLNYLFYISLIVLFLVIIGVFVVNNYISNSQVKLKELESLLVQIRTPENISLESEVRNYERKIKDFAPLLEAHLETSNVFKFLQEDCHPKAWFQQFSLDSKQNKVNVSGKTQSFETLGQQILIFKNDELVQDVKLEQVSLGKEGKIDFNLSISLNPQIFK
jgi:hypothetical protein